MGRSESSSRGRRTLVYFLITIVAMLAGVVLTLWAVTLSAGKIGFSGLVLSVGTSVLASGLVGLLLAIQRLVDDNDQSRSELETVASLSALSLSIEDVSAEIVATRTELGRSIRIQDSANLRTITDLQISDEFRRSLKRSVDHDYRKQAISVDVAGLKLNRFLTDQLEWLTNQSVEVNLRMLLQSPGSDAFNAICKLEGRSIDSTIHDIAETVAAFEGSSVVGSSLQWKRSKLKVEVRLLRDYQPVTLFRVGDRCCVRPRISTPGGPATRFYESYDKADGGQHFSIYSSHFDRSWRNADFMLDSAAAHHIPQTWDRQTPNNG